MAHKKKGVTVAAAQRWKHLRKWKRNFWKRQRLSDKRMVRPENPLSPRREL